MLSIEKPTISHRESLATFFGKLRAEGVERFFKPHPLDDENAATVCGYQGKDLYYVAILSGEILAYGMLRGWDQGYDIPSLGIALLPDQRGSRLARTMMEFLHTAAQTHGAFKVRLRVHDQNRPAIQLYRNLGYNLAASEGNLLVGYYKLNDGHKIPWARPVLFGDEKYFASAAIETTALSGGPHLNEFEHEFAKIHSIPDVLCVSNGTSAIHLAYLALGIDPGDEIIVPAWAFMAAANITLLCGARPVFADVNPDTWLLDPMSVRQKITSKTKAIVAIHTYGNLCEMESLLNIAEENKVVLMEDCAESLFSKYDGKVCGAFGHIATWSFQATKTITCGEGGAVAFRDPSLREKAKLIRSHGMTAEKKYKHILPGHNFRLTNVHGAILHAQIAHRHEIEAMRASVYHSYVERLSEEPRIRLQKIEKNVQPVMWATGAFIDFKSKEPEKERDKLIEELKAEGIETRPGFYSADQHSIYGSVSCPEANKIARSLVALPMPADLSQSDLHYVCDKLLEKIS